MKSYNKKWNPDGWYYDEDKAKWIAPDYRYINDGKFEPIYKAEHGEKSPSGWIYDRDTLKWNPPKSLEKEAHKKWRWDEEKRIWVDIEKEKRLERHRQWRKEEGKGPTFEEWKTQRIAENSQEEARQNENAAPQKTPTE